MFVPLGTQKICTFDQEKNVTLTRTKDSAFLHFSYIQWIKLYEISQEITNALRDKHDFSATIIKVSEGQEIRVKVYQMACAHDVWLCDIRLTINHISQPLFGVALTLEQWIQFLDILTCLKQDIPVKGAQDKIGPVCHSQRLQELADAVCSALLYDAVATFCKTDCYGCKMKKGSQKHHTCLDEVVGTAEIEAHAEKAKLSMNGSTVLLWFITAHHFARETMRNPSWPFFVSMNEYKIMVEKSLNNFPRIKNLAITQVGSSADKNFEPMIATVLRATRNFFASLEQ